MSKKVIIFGSMNMDFSIACEEMPKQGQTIQGRNLLISQGGKGANQALAAKKLGADVKMIGCVGGDNFADILVNDLKNNGICTNHILKSDDKSSGIAFILRVDNDNRIIINHGANHHIKQDKIISMLKELYDNKEINEGDIFICQLECDKKAVCEALKLAKKLNLYTIFNPAPAKVIDSEYFQYIDLFILNQSENEFYTNIVAKDKESIEKSMDLLLGFGVKEVVLTLSGDGCAYKKQDEEIKLFKAYKVDPIDTTAAGDTFIGGLCANLSKNTSIDEAIVLGSKAAALSTLKMGAGSSVPTLDEVNNFFKD